MGTMLAEYGNKSVRRNAARIGVIYTVTDFLGLDSSNQPILNEVVFNENEFKQVMKQLLANMVDGL